MCALTPRDSKSLGLEWGMRIMTIAISSGDSHKHSHLKIPRIVHDAFQKTSWN